MPAITPKTVEDEAQLRFLNTPQGEAGSGATRYAAAMYFFQRGMLGEHELESYRAASKVDGISPIARLASEIEHYIEALEFAGNSDVTAGLARWTRGAPRQVTPKQVPTPTHLPAALEAMSDRALAAAIRDAWPLLRWVTYPYPASEIGPTFPQSHAFASLIGEGAPYAAPDFDLGLFVIAPHVLYRDHQHAAPELYAPLTGPHGRRFTPGTPMEAIAAGVPIWNEPLQPHATLTGVMPFLAVYCWTKDVNKPARVIPSADWPDLEKS